MRDVRIILNLTRGNVLCEQVEIADSALPRMRGLLGRRSLPSGQGILLQPAPSIHTAFMRFQFDVVFLDASLRVIRTVEHVRPWRVVIARHAASVLELAAGEVSRRNVELGDQIVVADSDLAIGAVAPASSAQDAPVEPNGAPTETAEGASADRADAPKVLLVGSDRRFRSVTAALLQRRGYSVTIGEQMASMAEVAARERVDVVVLDTGALPALAALEAAKLEALNPSVGMIFVSDGIGQALPSTPVLPKWGSFDGLYDAIEVVRAAKPPSGRS
jgi:uncharacterized membrane protein (UPF0127 family)/CheY-like chemotaxis protein